ncbi:MAG: hypothetical protein HY906_24960 [Deltaproteobacteria bacterium]|nr:hypothetical protein [Deltaproteobacteria bacterium]
MIRRDAAAEDIFADAATTHTNAQARGGAWQQLADERLKVALEVSEVVKARRLEAQRALPPLMAAIETQDIGADRLLGRTGDDLWNALGRPSSDPVLSVIFPGGISYYTEGPDVEQPDRMELLAELLESIHLPKLDPARAQGAAQEVRAAAQPYRAAVEAARIPRARVKLLDRVLSAVARATQIELAQLKRLYKAQGFSEAEIHTVIPDRPAPVKKPPAPLPPA